MVSVDAPGTKASGRRATVVAARAAFETRVRAVVARPADLVVTAVMYLLVTTALSTLWRVAVGAAGGEMVGYGVTAIVWYIAATEAAVMPVPNRLIEDESFHITRGQVEIDLLRPVSVVAIRLAGWLGYIAPRVLLCAVIGGGFAWVVGGAHPTPASLPLAILAVALGASVNVVAQVGVAGLSFWVRDVRGLWFLYQKVVFVIGGMFLPLEILPPGLEQVAKATPFMAMAYVPGRLAAGFVEIDLLLRQLFWLVVLGIGVGWLYRRGTERLRRQP